MDLYKFNNINLIYQFYFLLHFNRFNSITLSQHHSFILDKIIIHSISNQVQIKYY